MNYRQKHFDKTGVYICKKHGKLEKDALDIYYVGDDIYCAECVSEHLKSSKVYPLDQEHGQEFEYYLCKTCYNLYSEAELEGDCCPTCGCVE